MKIEATITASGIEGELSMCGVLEQDDTGATLLTDAGRFILYPAGDCLIDGTRLEPMVGRRVDVVVAAFGLRALVIRNVRPAASPP